MQNFRGSTTHIHSTKENNRDDQDNAPIRAAATSTVTAGPPGEAFANVLSCASAPLAAAVRASRIGTTDHGCNGECRKRELHGVGPESLTLHSSGTKLRDTQVDQPTKQKTTTGYEVGVKSTTHRHTERHQQRYK